MISLDDLIPYIDWSPFFHTWELRGRYPAIFDDPVVGTQARELFEDAQKLLDRIRSAETVGLFTTEQDNPPAIARALGTNPVVVFASSVAVFGASGEHPLPDVVDDHTAPNPQSSYGAQKVIGVHRTVRCELGQLVSKASIRCYE